MGEVTEPLASIGDVEVEQCTEHSWRENGNAADGRGASPRGIEAISPWPLTTALLLGDMFGLGALTLPADFAQLGWVAALSIISLCALGMCYSGVLFARLATAFPRVDVFDRFGVAAFGKAGQRLVFATIYACILITPVIFQITIVESLVTMFPGRLSSLAGHALVTAVMIPVAQVRHLEEVGWISLGGTVCMAGVVVIALGKVVMLPAGGSTLHSYGLLPGASAAQTEADAAATATTGSPSVRLRLVAAMDVVFAYGGAANWMRYITGMKERRHFTRVASAGAGFMTLCYVALGAAGYAKLGDDFDRSKPITSVLPYDAWIVAMNLLLLLHCVVAYQININVWTDLVLNLLGRLRVAASEPHPERLQQPLLEAPQQAQQQQQQAQAPPGWLVWCATSTVGLAFCLGMGILFPYFTVVVALISSVGDLAAAYALPALFSLKLLKLPGWERVLCVVLVPVAFGISGVGMYSSLSELISKMAGGSA